MAVYGTNISGKLGRGTGLGSVLINSGRNSIWRSGLVVETWEKKSRALRELATPSLSVNFCAVLLSAVLNGAGVSMLPTYMATLYPDLLMLDYGIVYSDNFWLVRTPHTTRLGRVNTVADWLVDSFSSQEQPWFDRDYIRPSEFSDIEIIMPHEVRSLKYLHLPENSYCTLSVLVY